MALIYHVRPVTPNIGNDLITMAVQGLLAEAADHPRDLITVPAKGVASAIKRGGLVASTIDDVNRMGAGVLVGPGNLFENAGLEVEPGALDALRVPMLLFSVSWGRTFDDQGRLHARTDALRTDTIVALCRKACKVLVRDEPTLRFLQTHGVQGAEIIGCPVLALKPEEVPLPRPDPRAQGAVLVSVRNPLLMNVSPRLQGRVHADVRRILDLLRAMGHRKPTLLCHDPRDLRFAAAYSDVPALYTEDPRQFLGWLRDCALSVTFRLHALLPCALLGTPSVHFSYDERALGLVGVAGLQDCDVDYVRSSDPVRQAMEMCASTDRLARAAAAARPSWARLRTATLAALSEWMRGMDQPA
jgi:polysaccharide pyruvyl transferase WcaK-like protein